MCVISICYPGLFIVSDGGAGSQIPRSQISSASFLFRRELFSVVLVSILFACVRA